PHQRNGVGATLLAVALTAYFRALPWLLTVTVQTNEDRANRGIITLYRRMGFRGCYEVRYADKTDILMELSRGAWETPNGYGEHRRYLPGRREAVAILKSVLPNPLCPYRSADPLVVHFATGSREKWRQYQFLFRSVGVD